MRRGSAVDLEAATDGLAAPDTAHELVIDLQRCLMQLPEDHRAVLLLVSLEEMGYAQVARILDIPIGTVMSRLARARQRLQLLLDAPVNTPATVIPLKRLK